MLFAHDLCVLQAKNYSRLLVEISARKYFYTKHIYFPNRATHAAHHPTRHIPRRPLNRPYSMCVKGVAAEAVLNMKGLRS